MEDIKDIKYEDYLNNHLEGIQKGYNWLQNNLPGIFIHNEYDYSNKVKNLIDNHDESKYSIKEWIPYREYFYGVKTDNVRRDFDYAWLHHIHNNPHHWQYWVLIGDESGIKALDIPYEYIIEMFLDHWSFSWKEGNLFEIKNWYNSHKDIIIFSENTKRLYENILFTVLDLLNEGSIS